MGSAREQNTLCLLPLFEDIVLLDLNVSPRERNIRISPMHIRSRSEDQSGVGRTNERKIGLLGKKTSFSALILSSRNVRRKAPIVKE